MRTAAATSAKPTIRPRCVCVPCDPLTYKCVLPFLSCVFCVYVCACMLLCACKLELLCVHVCAHLSVFALPYCSSSQVNNTCLRTPKAVQEPGSNAVLIFCTPWQFEALLPANCSQQESSLTLTLVPVHVTVHASRLFMTTPWACSTQPCTVHAASCCCTPLGKRLLSPQCFRTSAMTTTAQKKTQEVKLRRSICN